MLTPGCDEGAPVDGKRRRLEASPMEDRTTPPPAQRQRVTVARILREFAEADSTPFAPDEIDAIVYRASVVARLRPV
jgi:hypothetical protein